jgi:hypothetical protein
MANDSIREYLTLLMAAVSDSVNGAEIIDTEEGPALLCSVDSPFGGGSEVTYQFSIMPISEGFLSAETLLFLFTGVGDDRRGDIDALIAKLNPYITIGSLRFVEEAGSVVLANGFVFEETDELTSVTDLIGKTVALLENIAVNAGGYIHRYLSGEKPETLLEEIDREGTDL